MSGQLNATIGEASRMMAQKERSNRTEQNRQSCRAFMIITLDVLAVFVKVFPYMPFLIADACINRQKYDLPLFLRDFVRIKEFYIIVSFENVGAQIPRKHQISCQTGSCS